MTWKVAEKFISINGEGPLAGMLAAFIRLKGCNLNCTYCDTSWANEPACPAVEETAESLIAWLKEHEIPRVTLTGGEPLLAEGIGELMEALGEAGIRVEVETNGSIDLRPFDKLTFRPAYTMDYKCPDSGMEAFMKTENFSVLSRRDSVKFVVSSIKDLERAYEICSSYRLTKRCQVYLSPVFDRIEPKDIVLFMEEKRWNDIRLQLQLHKYIWPPEMRGV